VVNWIDCVEHCPNWDDIVDDIYEQISGEGCDKLKRSLKLEHTEHNHNGVYYGRTKNNTGKPRRPHDKLVDWFGSRKCCTVSIHRWKVSICNSWIPRSIWRMT